MNSQYEARKGPRSPPRMTIGFHSGLLLRHDSHSTGFFASWRDSLPSRRLKVMLGFGSPTDWRAASGQPFHRVSLIPTPKDHTYQPCQESSVTTDLNNFTNSNIFGKGWLSFTMPEHKALLRTLFCGMLILRVVASQSGKKPYHQAMMGLGLCG